MENGKSRLRQAQEDVEDVKIIMMDNLNKAEERSGKLGDLEDRAEQLLEKSKAFEKTAKKVKQQKRWENRKTQVVQPIGPRRSGGQAAGKEVVETQEQELWLIPLCSGNMENLTEEYGQTDREWIDLQIFHKLLQKAEFAQ
ncbi:hypothetical protein SKAU_G00000820 [Synaphobranchus kaupii]|uniref:V-SNARE coiled-coil homology domain-containing protein n=1 Tax=Synaphobranchus kaupii TaxID=118154 RepID=A0A9Q1JCG7_SYNKA|nr:hypothetical protein SKAU_G00000820 [Synaphobranchus kaupii]